MASNDDILRVLGQLEAKLDAVADRLDRSDEVFAAEQKSAHISRSRIHLRIDEQAKQISHLDTTIAISGGVDAQIREEIKALKETVEKNHSAVTPALEEWKRMKTLGYGISGLIAFAGLTIGGTVAYMSDGAVSALRHWLKIN